LIGGDRIVKKSKLDWTASMAEEERAGRKKAFETEQNDRVQENAFMRDGTSGDDTGSCITNVSRMAISADGQWLATTDDLARTYIFNLDSVQVRSFSLP